MFAAEIVFQDLQLLEDHPREDSRTGGDQPGELLFAIDTPLGFFIAPGVRVGAHMPSAAGQPLAVELIEFNVLLPLLLGRGPSRAAPRWRNGASTSRAK